MLTDTLAWRSGVHVLAIANVDAHVVWGKLGTPEEEVTLLQSCRRNSNRLALVNLAVSSPADVLADGVAVDV